MKQGHRYNGNPLSIDFIGSLGSPGTGKVDVLANVIQERRSEVDETGKKYVTDKRKKLRLNFELLHTEQSWSVSTIKVMN